MKLICLLSVGSEITLLFIPAVETDAARYQTNSPKLLYKQPNFLFSSPSTSSIYHLTTSAAFISVSFSLSYTQNLIPFPQSVLFDLSLSVPIQLSLHHLIINPTIFPFTISPSPRSLSIVFLSLLPLLPLFPFLSLAVVILLIAAP